MVTACFSEDETEKIKDLFKKTKTNEDKPRASLKFLINSGAESYPHLPPRAEPSCL